MKKISYTIFLVLLSALPILAQSYAFGFKGGLVGGLQRFNGLNNREILLGYQGDAFIATADEEDKFSLFAQAGYHQRGSAIRFIGGFNPWSGENLSNVSDQMIFHNLALILGGTQKFDWALGKYYYSIGIRGEYTLDWDLGFLDNLNNQDQFVREFLYGVSFSVGWEYPFSDLVGGILELSIHPDLSRQMFLPEQRRYNPNTGNPADPIPAENIHNISIELSVGMRFLHQIEIIE
jgi:hypothetical protein